VGLKEGLIEGRADGGDDIDGIVEGLKIGDRVGNIEGSVVGVRSQVAQQVVQHSQTTSFEIPAQSANNEPIVLSPPHNGTVPVNKPSVNFACRRFGKLTVFISLGIVPVNRLSSTSSSSKLDNIPISDGSSPVKLVPRPTRRFLRLTSSPISLGNFPERPVLYKSRYSKLVICPISVGRVPIKSGF